MSATSQIEWTDATWNPLVGCTKVSPGCDNCYAETQINTRFHPAALAKGGKQLEAFPAPFDQVSIRPDRFLIQPLHWETPRRVFVNSLSDLFHDDVPDEFIAKVFAVMALAKQHTFQLLTKRHGRMRSLLNSDAFWALVSEREQDFTYPTGGSEWFWDGQPLPNVWLGVSVENQQWANVRIPVLLDTPAAVRFLSCEPLLGPIDLNRAIEPNFARGGWKDLSRLHWVIAGGESGPGARPLHPDWARSLRDQCVAAGVPFLFKQWGNWAPAGMRYDTTDRTHLVQLDGRDRGIPWCGWKLDQPTAAAMHRSDKRAAGRELDGRTWDEYPAVAS
jgi:protein gp37